MSYNSDSFISLRKSFEIKISINILFPIQITNRLPTIDHYALLYYYDCIHGARFERNQFVESLHNLNKAKELLANKYLKKIFANYFCLQLFGKDNIPRIGKRHNYRNNNENDDYPELIEQGSQYIQMIESNKDSIIRAFVNSYYWINNPLYDTYSRNLGYINELQTALTYLFKADIIDFVQNNLIKGEQKIKEYLVKYFKNENNFFESTLNKFRKTSFNTDGKVELFILSHLIDIPIVVYDNYSNIKYIFLQGEIPVTPDTIKKFTAESNLNKTIFLKFDFDSSNTIPKNIYSIYYI
jgi:hypothetical protein